MSKDNKELIKRYYAEIYSNHNVHLFDQILAPDFYHRNTKLGVQWYRQFLEDLFEAFPDFRFELDDLIAERDIVICWGIFNCGVSVKEWAGVAPMGNLLVFHGTVMHRIKDGKIIEQWSDQWYTSVPEMLEHGSNLDDLPRPREIGTASGAE